MPLKPIVRKTIQDCVENERESHTAADVLRALRDEASLLYERQQICDNLDADPMKQLQDCQDQCRRIKVNCKQQQRMALMCVLVCLLVLNRTDRLF